MTSLLAIQTFVLNKQDKQLTVELASSDQSLKETWQFSYEFLRVIPTSQAIQAGKANAKALAPHKKASAT